MVVTSLQLRKFIVAKKAFFATINYVSRKLDAIDFYDDKKDDF